MPLIIRTAFNSQNWNGQCRNADRDRRLFQCREVVVNTGYEISKDGDCTSECWEQALCSNYEWFSTKGEFGERANGPVFFLYKDIDETLVLWGRSVIQSVNGNKLTFKRFKPFSDSSRKSGLTYRDLEELGVPEWRSGTFRYISDETVKNIEQLISNTEDSFSDSSEPECSIEGRQSLRIHMANERSSRLVKAFKANLKDYSCSVCGFSFEHVYGNLGRDFIEAHHTITISSLSKETKMSISDLIAVCSNCHRMLHKSDPPLSGDGLKQRIEAQSSATAK